MQDNKISIQNSVAFIHINSEPAGKEGREVISFIAIPSKVPRNRPSHSEKLRALTRSYRRHQMGKRLHVPGWVESILGK